MASDGEVLRLTCKVGGNPKLVLLLWHMLKFKEAFNPEVFAKEEAKMRRKKLQRLEAMATTLNYRIIPIQ